MSYWSWVLTNTKRKLWWQAVLYCILGVLTAICATMAERFFPWPLPFEIDRAAVESLLNVISSSMLAVTTFSLGAMTAAFGAATSNVTPRATKLLMEDRVTHNVLSTFIGAFIFSIVALVVLKTGSYGEHGRAVLFVITILVLGLVVTQLIRWVNHLILLGRVGNTIDQIEKATAQALELRQSTPYLGGTLWADKNDIPLGAKPINAGQVGYIQFIDIQVLSEICEAKGLEVYLPINSGNLVYVDSCLLWVTGPIDDEITAELRDQFIIGNQRSFEQDPRFGLSVMSEVGSRALSPATNDPGTALDILTRQTRLLTQWSQGREPAPVLYPLVHIHPLSDEDLFEDAFMLMARDGAHLVEIQLRLLKSLAALQRLGNESFKAAAKRQADLARERAEASLTTNCDKARLKVECQL